MVLLFSFKISNLLICVCSFDSSCPILEKDGFIEHLYIALSCLILFLICLFRSCSVLDLGDPQT